MTLPNPAPPYEVVDPVIIVFSDAGEVLGMAHHFRFLCAIIDGNKAGYHVPEVRVLMTKDATVAWAVCVLPQGEGWVPMWVWRINPHVPARKGENIVLLDLLGSVEQTNLPERLREMPQFAGQPHQAIGPPR